MILSIIAWLVTCMDSGHQSGIYKNIQDFASQFLSILLIPKKGGNKPNGKGHAEGKVCPKHSPFGKFKGNVFHDSGRFGLYFDNQESLSKSFM